MRIETWISDKGDEEVHHFIDLSNIYLFGFNKKILGDTLYGEIRVAVEARLRELGKDVWAK